MNRLAYVCGWIPESKEPGNRLICKKCSGVALRNMYAGSLPEARRITSGDLQRLCAKLTQQRGCVLRSKGKKLYARLFTHRKCMFIHSKSTTLHMRSDTLVNNDMS